MKGAQVVLQALALFASGAAAAEPGVETAPPSEDTHRWGVEVELVQPFVPEVHIVSVRATRTLWGRSGALRGDLMLGVFLRPDVTHDVVETIDEYLLAVGYRQYLWRGLHAELAVLAGWAWGTNNRIDGRDYSNPVILVDGNVGYRFGFFEPGAVYGDGRSWGVYLTPQVGVVAGAYTDIGPRGGKSDVFPQAKLLLGVSF